MDTLAISSPAFTNNSVIPSRYTCDGEDSNPPLEISGVPEGAKSLALIVDDPDAPSHDFVHWVMWNISSNTREIAENMVPQGAAEGMTDFGKTGFGGPCPRSGTHRYYFKLYALDTTFDLPASTSKKELEAAMRGHILDDSELLGLYTRARG